MLSPYRSKRRGSERSRIFIPTLPMRGRQLQKPERSQHLVNDPFAGNPILGRTNTGSTNPDRWAADSRTPPFQMALQQSGELPGLEQSRQEFPDADDEGTAASDPGAARIGDLPAERGGRDPRPRRARLDAIRMPAIGTLSVEFGILRSVSLRTRLAVWSAGRSATLARVPA